jgi:hypothetical protein
MPHVTCVLEHGPEAFHDCGTNTIIGGRLVMPDAATGYIKHTTAATTKCLGVATDDAGPLAGQSVSGYDVTSAILPSETAVAFRGVWKLEFSVAAAFGDLLVADADGKVKPYTAGTSTFDQIIGKCVERSGVLINTRGKVRLTLG